MEQFTANTFSFNFSENRTPVLVNLAQAKDVSKHSELFSDGSLLELCNSFWMRSPGAKNDLQPYLRGCKWSPDGTCCLSVVNHDGFHIMELPRDLYEGCPTRNRMITLLPAVIHVKDFGLVYDFCWYPNMNSHYPETCSWISTKINSPIQMWDAYDGSLRCSYRGYNAVDEMEPAISVTFIDQGHRIVGGYKNCLRTFDVERPGRDFLEHKINSPASCFATNGSLLAVGSWNSNIKLFSILDNGTYRSVGNLYANTGGITHLQFTPDGSKLVSGARKDHNLCVWDIRYHKRPLNILKRRVSTNQRIYFDISSCGRYLVSGGTDGVVRVWDNNLTRWTEQFSIKRDNQENATFQFQIYRDCCNSVSIHPSRPILATGSGQYHFLDPVKALENELDIGTDHDRCTRVQSSSASIASSGETEKADDLVTEPHEMKSTNEVSLHTDVSEHISNEGVTIDSAKELSDNKYDRGIPEECPSKVIDLETCSEPLAKKFKLSNEINSSTDKKLIDAQSHISEPVLETSGATQLNVVQTYEELQDDKNSELNSVNQMSTETSNLNDTPKDKEQVDSRTKTDTVDNAVHEIRKESAIVQKLDNITRTTEQALHNTSKQCNERESTKKDIIDVEFPNKGDEVDSALIQEHNLTNIEEAHRNIVVGTLSASNSFDGTSQRFCKENTNSQPPTNLVKLEETVVSPTKIPNVRHIKQPPNITCLRALESDGDCNAIDENKMKYSSYAENNLTFWWIGTILDS